MRLDAIQSDILRYILENGYGPGDRLPTIQTISQAMDVSVAKARESLEVARALGIVEVKPGRGTRVSPYSFAPAATLGALFAIGMDEAHFAHLRELRKALEIQFWDEATGQLTPADLDRLRELIAAAFNMLETDPVQVPAKEHRAFHLTIFSHLDNLFVLGILEAFWEAYEAFGLNLYRELSYHRTVWEYHARMVDAIEAGDIERGRRLLIEHMNLMQFRQAAERSENSASGPRAIQFE
ncbi:MAG: FadR/GntR family transcriptional regulator [Anaerolineae bacterium]